MSEDGLNLNTMCSIPFLQNVKF